MSKHAIELYARWNECYLHCRKLRDEAEKKGHAASRMMHIGHVNALSAAMSDLYLWSPSKTKAALRKWIKENVKE